MKLKIKIKKWDEKTEKELASERRQSYFFVAIGIAYTIIILVFGVVGWIKELPGMISLCIIISIVGLIQRIRVDFELKFRKLEAKMHD